MGIYICVARCYSTQRPEDAAPEMPKNIKACCETKETGYFGKPHLSVNL